MHIVYGPKLHFQSLQDFSEIALDPYLPSLVHTRPCGSSMMYIVAISQFSSEFGLFYQKITRNPLWLLLH